MTFQWTGLHKDFFCPPPKIVVVCGGAPLVDRFGQAETDDCTRFEVSRNGVAEWSLAFFPTETETGQPRCIQRPKAMPRVEPSGLGILEMHAGVYPRLIEVVVAVCYCH